LDPGLGSGSQLYEPRLVRLRLGVFESMDNIINFDKNIKKEVMSTYLQGCPRLPHARALPFCHK
jgi:hypothetical protein